MVALWIIASFIMVSGTEPPQSWFETRCSADGGILLVEPGTFPVNGQIYRGHWYTCAPKEAVKPEKPKVTA